MFNIAIPNRNFFGVHPHPSMVDAYAQYTAHRVEIKMSIKQRKR